MIATLASSLAACSAVPSLHMSYGGAGASSSTFGRNDDRLHHRAFYKDEGGTPAWMKEAPHYNR